MGPEYLSDQCIAVINNILLAKMPSQIDQYTLLKTLGSGVSAKVKLAQDPSGQQVALKVFDLTNPSCNEKILAALRREV